MKRIKTSDLSCACLWNQAVAKDWTALNGDDEAGWQAWAAEKCEKCGEYVLLEPGEGNVRHKDISDEKCSGHVSLFEGPMMNYWYPIDNPDVFGIQEEALKIKHLPLCIVLVDDVWGLALTGGGMDFTWEIVEAFVALGYLPPIHFARKVPGMADRGISPKDQYLMRACRKALVVGMRQLRYGMRNLAHVAVDANDRATRRDRERLESQESEPS